MPSPIRFCFGASGADGTPVTHVIEYGRLAQYGSGEGERLYATRQSSLRTATSSWHPSPTSLTTPTMADPKKQEKDFTKEVDTLLPEARTLAKVRTNGSSNLSVALTSACLLRPVSCRRLWTSSMFSRSKLEMYASSLLVRDLI